jgi:hypothetical protein
MAETHASTHRSTEFQLKSTENLANDARLSVLAIEQQQALKRQR